MTGVAIDTERLRMRSWRDDDVVPFQVICSDPAVMATLGPPLDLAATEALVDRMRGLQAAHGHCFWALERQSDARLIGWCGVIRGTVGPVANKAEIGWRLARDAWGAGYATEAARGAIDWSFSNLSDAAVWAITARGNDRSRAVMARLGMQYRPDLDFDHPKLAAGDPLRPHVAYSLPRPVPEIP